MNKYIDILFVGEFIYQKSALNFLDFLLGKKQRKKSFSAYFGFVEEYFSTRTAKQEN